MAEEEIRLNKYLSEAGICSRREADRCIEAGKVLVNGKVAGMGQKVKMSFLSRAFSTVQSEMKLASPV